MHLYNAWLPPPVAEETKREKEAFTGVVKSIKESYNADDPESVYATLKFVPIADLFIKAKSELLLEDVSTLVTMGLELFQIADNKLYAQVRWGSVLVKTLIKYRKKLSLKVEWRPLFNSLIHTHFTRNTGSEGWRLRQQHFETMTSLVRACRKFFPPGSALEIWTEFGSLLQNPWHNSSFEGSGFVRLFLPTNTDNKEFYTRDWSARVIKNNNFMDWEDFVPTLFNKFLNMFEELPVWALCCRYTRSCIGFGSVRVISFL